MIAVWIALGFSLLYFLLQLYYLYHWNKIQVCAVPSEYAFTTGVTIIIVVHNEEKSIGECLHGILKQEYPPSLIEILVVDDHSTDGTVDQALKSGGVSCRLLQLKDFPEYIHPPAFKKSGITLGVNMATFETIVVTDGDCVHPPEWLRSVLYPFEKNNLVFQTAPVLFTESKTLLGKMQEMEQLVLMLITGAGIHSRLHDMANGANMVFTKKAFHDVNGYEGNYQFASGDDMFLAEKMRKSFPNKISFVKSLNATVYTEVKHNWASFLKQRLRWAGKNKGLKRKTIHCIWFFVGAYHVQMITMLLLAMIQVVSWWPFIFLLGSKWVADYLSIASADSFFQKKSILKYFIPLQVLYTYYIFRIGITMTLEKKGDWKSEK